MKIKIKSCSIFFLWYAKYIDKEFDVLKEDREVFWVYEPDPEYRLLNWVYKKDAERI
jgi:hypothetical protein